MLSTTLISSLSLIALNILNGVNAQEPPYLSPVLVQPGLSSQKCIQPKNGASAANTPVVLAACTGSTAQEWFFSSNQIRVFSNMCLTVPGGSTANGVQLTITTCDSSNANQKFYYNFFNHNQISWLNKGKCVDLNGGALTDGTAIQSWACSNGNANQVWNVGYLSSNLPAHSESGQSGTNNCGTGSSQSSQCQTSWINDVDDFCLFAPPSYGGIGDTERIEVSWCTKSGRGTRVIPDGTLTGVHFVKTPDYVQVTGVGNLGRINVSPKDGGGELDPHGADGKGNPIGGLVYGNSFAPNQQYHEWTQFIDDKVFCMRACVGKNAAQLCNHIYDEMGCEWNMPGNYGSGVFESCLGDDDLPMGVYGTSTWHQGTSPTPGAHPAAPSSDCRRVSSVHSGPAGGPSTTPHPTTTTTTHTSTSSAAPPAGSTHVIHPKASSSKCLNASSNSNGAHVTIQDCNGSTAQKWVKSGSQFKIYSNKCLDVTDGNNVNGNKMQIWSCGSTNANQQWTTNAAGNIQWSGKGKCLDLTDGKTTNGNQIQIWGCGPAGNANQIWNIV